MNKSKILKKYERLVDETFTSSPLCAFLGNNFPKLADKFEKYLEDENILECSDSESIYWTYFVIEYTGDYDKVLETKHLANCFRYLVLEDFLNKHL